MMTFQKIASQLAKREGKKSQAKIHDVRELLRILVEWEAAEFDHFLDGPIESLRGRARLVREKRFAREAKKAAKAKK